MEGVRFAQRAGYTEVERYVLPGDPIPFITLRNDGQYPLR